MVEESETRLAVTGYFETAQFASGRLAVGVIPNRQPQPSTLKLRLGSDAALSFTGEDLNQWNVKATGETFFSRIPWMLLPLASTRPTELSFGAQYFEAFRRGATSSGYSMAHFLISNMLWHARSTEDPEPIRLEARGYQVCVNPVDDYPDVAERLTHGHGVEPTAWVCVESPQGRPKTLSDFSDLIDDLMYLFRLVTGNFVDWYYGEARNPAGGKAVERIHRYTTPTSYSNTVRFEYRKTGHTYLFSKLNLDNLATALFNQSGHGLDTKELKALINQFTTACSDSPFFESSGLLASTLTELIVSKRADAHKTSNIITRSRYKSQILPALATAIRSRDLSKEEQCSILDHVTHGYRRSFRQKLQELRDAFDLPFSDCDIKLIARTRNSLVHRGTFQSKAEDGGWRNDYDVMIWTDLIALCRLLGYRGDLPERREGQSIVV